ncbi:hypothetical protein K493DRAFT_312118 [Basidiobolus meristosporus CBS 931.73]|uniref:BZIP domain-containing protein n=1 Tax=Basidiobolus meristosporus CBS 931.73 TaxID=1314790 RepID=A0A1Y1YVZ8_9FUNG|nr:hypothetical protein K493DRAFT_312118 [Basidiobolus meristosporus CBS 931.73]|eukprot:ORY02210.1 hypothetical protein K493DRAFT_312118 [Basidiobolus meristosporus CBS 931.73]
MNSLKEADVENLFASNENQQLEDTILDQMLNLTDPQPSEVEGSRLLSESLGPLESLERDGSSKLFHPGKLDMLNGQMEPQFFDCTANKMVPVSDALLSRMSEPSSFATIAESPTNSDAPVSPRSSIQTRNSEFNLSWDDVPGFPPSSHVVPQSSIYQFSGYDNHLASRRASLPENGMSHFTQFPDLSSGRKRVVSWADLGSHSFETKEIDRNDQQSSQSLYGRRFSLHLPVHTTHQASKFYPPNNGYPEYGTMDLSLRNQFNLPIDCEPLADNKSKAHPYHGNYLPKPKSKEHMKPAGEKKAYNKRDSQASKLANPEQPVEMLDDFSDSNIDTKDLDPDEELLDSPKQSQTVVERRLSRRRERNRLAARRSREKRNQFLRELEQLNQSLNSENGALKASLCEALRELQILRAATSSNPNLASASSTSD